MIVALSTDRFGGRQREGDGRAAVEARAQLIKRWPLSNLTNLIKDIVRERHAGEGRT